MGAQKVKRHFSPPERPPISYNVLFCFVLFKFFWKTHEKAVVLLPIDIRRKLSLGSEGVCASPYHPNFVQQNELIMWGGLLLIRGFLFQGLWRDHLQWQHILAWNAFAQRAPLFTLNACVVIPQGHLMRAHLPRWWIFMLYVWRSGVDLRGHI